ncbi:hypothetical protein S83_033300 [Arachis hypogaea]|nr:Ethylene-responsive element binding factor [Arachis hypogaea]
MNNQARILNLNLEFGYDLNYGGAISVGGAINADPIVSCVDDNSEYGSGSGLASEGQVDQVVINNIKRRRRTTRWRSLWRS